MSFKLLRIRIVWPKVGVGCNSISYNLVSVSRFQVGELAGIAVGAAVFVDIIVAGYILILHQTLIFQFARTSIP